MTLTTLFQASSAPVPLVGPVAGELFGAGVAFPGRIGACTVLLAPAAVEATALLVSAWWRCTHPVSLHVSNPSVLLHVSKPSVMRAS